MKPWGLGDLGDNSFTISEPATHHTNVKRQFYARQPFIEMKGVRPLDGGGDTYYYRWNSDTLNLIRYAMSTDDLSRMSEAELEVWRDFVTFEDTYSTTPLDGYIGATTIDDKNYSYCVNEDFTVDYKAYAYEASYIRPQPVVGGSLDKVLMALVNGELELTEEVDTGLPRIECPVIGQLVNYVFNLSDTAVVVGEDLPYPTIQPSLPDVRTKLVSYHTKSNSVLTGFPNCPSSLSVFLNPCQKESVALTGVDDIPTGTSSVGGTVADSFDDDLSTAWYVAVDEEYIYVDLEYSDIEFFRWMTITAQTADFQRITTDFQVLGWSEHFQNWEPLSRRFIVDEPWESEVPKEFDIRGRWYSKIRIVIHDSKACLGGNVEFFSVRPDLLDGQNQVSTFSCSLDWNLLSVYTQRNYYNRVDLGYPSCATNTKTTFSTSGEAPVLPTSGFADQGYTVTESGKYSSFKFANLIDGDTSSRAVTKTIGAYLQVLCPNPSKTHRYEMTGNHYTSQLWQGWKLYATQDYITWIVIDEQTGQSLENGTPVNYDIAVPITAYGYKLEITELGTGGTYGESSVFTMFQDLFADTGDIPKPKSYDRFNYMTNWHLPTKSATQSGSNSANNAYKAFDDNNSTLWGVDSITDCGIGILTDEDLILAKYEITSQSSVVNQMPNTFEIQGSNDTRTWVVIDSQSGQTFTGEETKNYFLPDNDKRFRYHRMRTTLNNGDGGYTVLPTFNMYTERGVDLAYGRIPIVETLTSANGSEVEAIGSNSYNSTWALWKLFSNSAYDGWSAGGSAVSPWAGFQYSIDKKVKANLAKIQMRNDSEKEQPQFYELQGENVDGTWDSLRRIYWDEDFEPNEKAFNYFDNDTEYIGYRIIIHKNRGGSTWISLNLLQFYTLNEYIEPYIQLLQDLHTSLTEATGTVSASSNISNSADQPIEGANYNLGNMWTSLSGQKTGWFQYEFPTATVVDAYTMRAPNSYETRMPKIWNIEASNDGTTWTTLHEVVSWEWKTAELREYTFNNADAYIYYRISITENSGDSTYCGIGWLSFGKVSGDQYNKVFDTDGYRNVTPNRNTLTGFNGHCQILSEHGEAYGTDYSYQQLFNDDPDREVAVYTFDMTLKFLDQFKLGKYVMKARYKGNLNETIKDWTVQGSNDNATWTVLDTQVDQTFQLLEEKEYTMSHTETYSHYRFVATANDGHATWSGMGKLRIYEKE